ncbi:MAG TPA: secondary thiamine-phosphate synthase enzyme YjbQ [Blastocatellia bacterium]|nr:secondary thiamine-phosphate synthase enzyme YjbQ [Blastocatellia bacterium]
MLIRFPVRRPAPTLFQTIHHLIRLETQECLEFIDLTDEIIALVQSSGISHGMVNVQTQHTTAAIIVNEDEPLLLEDLRRTLEQMAPRSVAYRHDDFSIRTANLTPDEKPNGHAHCKALFLRSSETLNIVGGRPELGRWQRLFFVELDCARERTVSVMLMGQTE